MPVADPFIGLAIGGQVEADRWCEVIDELSQMISHFAQLGGRPWASLEFEELHGYLQVLGIWPSHAVSPLTDAEASGLVTAVYPIRAILLWTARNGVHTTFACTRCVGMCLLRFGLLDKRRGVQAQRRRLRRQFDQMLCDRWCGARADGAECGPGVV